MRGDVPMKKYVKYIIIILLIFLIGAIWVANTSEDDVERLLPDKTTLPEEIEKEISNLYVEKQRGNHKPFAYIFNPKEYKTSDEAYVLIALGDAEMKTNIDTDNKVVELIPLYYPDLYDEQIVWDSKDFGDESDELSYKFTMHRVKIKKASEYEFKFVLADDPRKEFRNKVPSVGAAGARSASTLPKPMKKRVN